MIPRLDSAWLMINLSFPFTTELSKIPYEQFSSLPHKRQSPRARLQPPFLFKITSLSCQSCSCSPSSFDVMSFTLRLTVSDCSIPRISVIHIFLDLTLSLFQFPPGLIFSFFWSSWHGVSFRFSVTYCFTWLGAYGSFIPFSIPGFGSRIFCPWFSPFFYVFVSEVQCFDIVLLILSSGSSSLCSVQ